jgi:transcriptional regulator with XRE-family HTH domain
MNRTDFKDHRENMGWTQKDAATALAVSVAQISAIENGRSAVTPTIATLFSLYKPFDRPGFPQGIQPYLEE